MGAPAERTLGARAGGLLVALVSVVVGFVAVELIIGAWLGRLGDHGPGWILVTGVPVASVVLFIGAHAVSMAAQAAAMAFGRRPYGGDHEGASDG